MHPKSFRDQCFGEDAHHRTDDRAADAEQLQDHGDDADENRRAAFGTNSLPIEATITPMTASAMPVIGKSMA